MIRYLPPKSQAWGHQLGRLSASSIVERYSQFLNDQCTVIESRPSDLTMTWESSQHPLISDVVAKIEATLGWAGAVNEMPGAGGELFRQCRWQFTTDMLAVVATWFDALSKPLKTRKIVAHSSTFWIFAWSDEPQPLIPLESAGGMLGIHLGQPHRVTTMFSFRDFNRYLRIKEDWEALGLAKLSDKHLRPKINASP
jgi:hypothetical protein